MNKLPAKQIYLLVVIIVGIIALSVYSTYALFTFESSTSNVVDIHIAKSLSVLENIYEYQQVSVDKNSVLTMDVDIYNDLDYDVCYGMWYKIIGNNIDVDKVQIFQISNSMITSSGVMESLSNVRVTVGIINDNDDSIRINLGTIGSKREYDSCSLNLSSDKMVVDSSYEMIENLSEKIYSERLDVKEIDEGYLNYDDISEELSFNDNDMIYIANEFNYENEIFKLVNPYNKISDVYKDYINEDKDIYLCIDGYECNTLYKVSKMDFVKKENINDDDKYIVILEEKMIGYLGGKNGLRKVNDDYIYYGDNPNNYVYFNCSNMDDVDSCEVWRILGIYYNKDNKYNLKLIRNDSIGELSFDTNNNDSLDWNSSSLSKYLNDEYKLNDSYNNYIISGNREIEIVTLEDRVIKKLEKEDNFDISVISLSEYLNTSLCDSININEYDKMCFKNNWLNNIEVNMMWTNTIDEYVDIEEDKIKRYGYSVGNDIFSSDINLELDVRPVVYLKDRIVVVAGDGSKDNPYIIR